MSIELNFGAVIFAQNVQILKEFYSITFCLEVIVDESDKAVLSAPYLTLTIHGIPEQVSRQIQVSVPPALREETPIKLCFPVDSISDVRSMLSTGPGEIYPEGREWSNNKFRACDGYDPEGNVFQIRETTKP